MSAATRAIIHAYRAELSSRPDGETHVADARGITHVVLGESPWQKTGCGIDIRNSTDMPMFSNRENAIPTWDDVSCIACLTRRQVEEGRASIRVRYDAALTKTRSKP